MTSRSVAPAALESEISWKASVHDQSQLEVTFDFTVRRPPGLGPGPVASPCFGVDLFILTPSTFVVGSETYPKERFYGDLTNYVRLHTPDLEPFSRCALGALDAYLSLGLSLGEKTARLGPAVQEVRLFANYVNLRLKRLFTKQGPRPGDYAPERLRDIEALVLAFREKYVSHALARSLLLDDELRQALLYVDEYLSTRLHGALTQAEMHDPGGMRGSLEREEAYRRERLGLAISGRSEQLALERYYHRHGNLKKFVSETLYLKRKVLRRDRVYRNLIGVVGAALAATFAQLAQMQTTMAQGADDFGLRFATILFLGVVAYVFKDRIKEVSKEYVDRKMRSRLPDHDVQLALEHFDPSGGRRDVDVARYHEFVRYLTLDGLDPDVEFVADQFRDPLADRQGVAVIHYTKKLWVEPAALEQLDRATLSLKDILRFSTVEFLEHLDDPTKDVKAFDSEDGCVVLRAPKVYHLDLVVRYFAQPGGSSPEHAVHVEALRLVMDKTGIVRLDRPVAEGRFWYGALEAAS